MIATIISRLFDPFAVLAVLFVLLFYDSPVFGLALCLMILLPFLLFVLAWKTKTVSNWDVTDRRQRPKILWTFVAVAILSSLILQTDRALVPLVALIGFTIITQFWKISGHAMAAALTSGYIVAHYGWSWWPVLLSVPLVGWARVVRKNHTIMQVIIGAIYSWCIVYFLA